MSSVTPEQWADFCREPNETTFAPIYAATRALVYTICYRLLRNEDDALDALQSAYARLITTARDPKTALRVSQPETLAGQLAWREAAALKVRRSRRARREVAVKEFDRLVDGSLSADQLAANRQLRDRLETLVATLPERYRVPVMLHYFNGMSHLEIAEAMGKSTSTISNQISRALRKLQPLLRRAGLGESGAVFGAILASGALLEPPSSATAAAIFANALAATTTGAAVGGLAASASIKLTIGSAIMSAKAAIIGGLVIVGAAGVITYSILSPPEKHPLSSRAASDMSAPDQEHFSSRSAPTMPAPNPTPQASTSNRDIGIASSRVPESAGI